MKDAELYCKRMLAELAKLPNGSYSFNAIERIVDYTEKEIEGEEQDFMMRLFIEANMNPYAFYCLLKFNGDKKRLADRLKCTVEELFNGGPKDSSLPPQ